jgi:hypothetical protein
MFAKSDDRRRCSWRAELPGRRRLRGSTMAARSVQSDLPHDLAQLVVEAGLDLDHGFWNLVANGATFQSLGRRPTRPGRQLIAAYRAELNEVERVVNLHVQAWRDGRPTPVGPDLDVMLARWRALQPGDELMVEWPTRRLLSPAPRVRRTPRTSASPQRCPRRPGRRGPAAAGASQALDR